MITRKEADLRFIRESAYIRFDNNVSTGCRLKTKELPHYKIWIYARELLKLKGFKFYVDRKFKNEYKILLPSNKFGIKKRLRFKTEIYPAGFEIQFFQNIKHVNKFGGYYDFDKYREMPKHHKIMFNHISKYIILELCNKFELKYYDQSSIRFPRLTGEKLIIKNIQEYSFDRCKQKSLKQTPKYMSDYDFKYNSKSGVGDTLKCGEIRKFKDYSGKIKKGKIYHKINNMWWVIISKYVYSNIASFNIMEKVEQ